MAGYRLISGRAAGASCCHISDINKLIHHGNLFMLQFLILVASSCQDGQAYVLNIRKKEDIMDQFEITVVTPRFL
jgi:hypothetical protein